MLVPGTADTPLTSWSLRGLGFDVGTGEPTPLPVAIAGWLLDGRSAHVLGTEVAEGLHRFDAVLAMGDASAARTDKAPLHLDPRAVDLDAEAMAAIEHGDLAQLRSLDLSLHHTMGATGAPVWRTLADLVAAVDSSELLAQADPYGVQYFVATWWARWAHPA